MTIDKHSLQELKKEEKRAIRLDRQRAMRRDAKLVMQPKPNRRLPDTPEVIAERIRVKRWEDSHKELVVANQKRQYHKRKTAAKDRIAEAIAQAEKTQRNVESIHETGEIERIED